MKLARSLARNATTVADLLGRVPPGQCRPFQVPSKYQSGDAWSGRFSLAVQLGAIWLTVTPMGPTSSCASTRSAPPLPPLARDVGGLVGPALHGTLPVDADHPSPPPLRHGRHERLRHPHIMHHAGSELALIIRAGLFQHGFPGILDHRVGDHNARWAELP